MAEARKATIKVSDDTHRNYVEGAHNGVKFRVPVNKEVQVSEGTLIALQDSGVNIDIIKPLPGEDADEGSSASSTLEGTAFRDEPPPAAVEAVQSESGEPATLSQVPDARTGEEKRQAQLANVSDPKDQGTGVTAKQRGLATDDSDAHKASKGSARKTSAKRASTPRAKAKG